MNKYIFLQSSSKDYNGNSVFNVVHRKLSERLKIFARSLVTFFSRQLLDLNIFHVRTFGTDLNQATIKQLGQWSTRLYLVLLITTLASLALRTVIQPETLTKTFLKPSLNFYSALINDHNETLNCPCSLISLPYNEYVQIQPILHQVRNRKCIDVRLIFFPLGLFQ
jgi:hypothetical protein